MIQFNGQKQATGWPPKNSWIVQHAPPPTFFLLLFMDIWDFNVSSGSCV